ncbi:hypothetical protein AAFC00_002878 [Neodothiora populina]|uniref:Peroxisomal membrane protein 4 n=1 Tax=Neodothiora populina TaxID=2781224 RepID=A0ABR3P8I8_9PEZI
MDVSGLQAALERMILDPKYHAPLTLVKAVRNGLVYGTKVRFPHALVMIFLFRSGTLQEKFRLIFKATRLHARNLAMFALIYKGTMLALSTAQGRERGADSFLAGLLGGYYVFGRYKSSVSQQIVIYVFARVILGVAQLAFQPPGDNTLVGAKYGGRGGSGFLGDALGLSVEARESIRKGSWPVFASLSWAGVMWMFRWYPDMLQPSMKSSMVYIYENADKWDSFRNFLIHNK